MAHFRRYAELPDQSVLWTFGRSVSTPSLLFWGRPPSRMPWRGCHGARRIMAAHLRPASPRQPPVGPSPAILEPAASNQTRPGLPDPRFPSWRPAWQLREVCGPVPRRESLTDRRHDLLPRCRAAAFGKYPQDLRFVSRAIERSGSRWRCCPLATHQSLEPIPPLRRSDHHVGVDAEREAGIGVAKLVHHRGGVLTAGDQQRGEGSMSPRSLWPWRSSSPRPSPGAPGGSRQSRAAASSSPPSSPIAAR